MYTARSSLSKTCGPNCRAKRARRTKAGDKREFAFNDGPVQAAMQRASEDAVAHLPEAARDALVGELAPYVREALSQDEAGARVLRSIVDMMELLPLATEGLAEDLIATNMVRDADGRPIRDDSGDYLREPDHDTRHKARALAYKYTIGQPGLAPQPEAPEQAPITVVFPQMEAPTVVDSTARDLPELEEGQRLCDMCYTAKPAVDFVGSSSRCYACHANNRGRIETAIAERTQQDT